MLQSEPQLSTGLRHLDRILKGVLAGDNIVWQVDSIEDYLPFVEPICAWAESQDRNLVYFRFARHRPLVGEHHKAIVRELDPQAGFETFLGEIHRTIESAGRGAFYVFDCISDLAADWYSDQMVGNFFRLTCPYLYDLGTVAYFALRRGYHSVHATAPVVETTQIFLDVYSHQNKLYLHPLKVQHRYSPTMHLLHVWDDAGFVAVTESHIIAEVLRSSAGAALRAPRSQLGVWQRTFLDAEEIVGGRFEGLGTPQEVDDLKSRLLRMVIARDERVLRLAERYLGLQDLVEVGRRMIGTGLIGGKSVGMLLARAILREADPQWSGILEVHDSFYVGSDVFYTFLVRNGCWWMRQEQKDPRSFLQNAERARQRILTGTFPEEIERQFEDMLDYFGQSPIIVRSSSLLEDNFGNAFAGKYESIFLVNQGSRDKRFEELLAAIRVVYASTMSEPALSYRARRGLLDCDEQMALLVQRVSGAVHGQYFYPHSAGVAYSFNPYKWSEDIDSTAGAVRLVFGLGTRAVNRSDDDYTRLVALNAPDRRLETTFDGAGQYTQRRVDVLDLEANQLISADFAEISLNCPGVPMGLFASRDEKLEREARERGLPCAPTNVILFEGLISETPFIKDMRVLLETLQRAYNHPVDVEFTANFLDESTYKLSVLQCRPLQVKAAAAVSEPPVDISPRELVLRTRGPVIGPSRIDTVDRIIYVAPAVYGHLSLHDRYGIARLVGELTHLEGPQKAETIVLLGPGRWGTTTPALGVPVSFAEINTVSVLGEIVAMHEALVPDVSLGTHFFSDLVEMDILYFALFPQHEGNMFNEAFFEEMPNRLSDLVPRGTKYLHAVKVVDPDGGLPLRFHADTMKQKVVCYFDPKGKRL